MVNLNKKHEKNAVASLAARECVESSRNHRPTVLLAELPSARVPSPSRRTPHRLQTVFYFSFDRNFLPFGLMRFVAYSHAEELAIDNEVVAQNGSLLAFNGGKDGTIARYKMNPPACFFHTHAIPPRGHPFPRPSGGQPMPSSALVPLFYRVPSAQTAFFTFSYCKRYILALQGHFVVALSCL